MSNIIKVCLILLVAFFIVSFRPSQQAFACVSCNTFSGPICGGFCTICYPVPCQLYLGQYLGQYTSQYSTQRSCAPACSACINGNESCITSSCTTYNVGCSTPPPATPVPCPGSGIPSSGWGGGCPGGFTANQYISCGTNGTCGYCSVAVCTYYSQNSAGQNTYCWYNSGACNYDQGACSGVNPCNGQNKITQQCMQTNSGPQFVNVGQSCVANGTCSTATPTPTPLPNCTTNLSCNPNNCGVQCGNGTMPCFYTGPQPCNQVVAPSQPCNKNCPNGQNCQQNLCVANNTISGNVYVDTNVDTFKDNGEVNYTGNAVFNLSTGATATAVNGTYTFTNLLPGNYAVTYSNPPTGAGGYSITYPPNGPPPSLNVSVGSGSCNTNGAHDASCDANGNITSLDFGITNNKPWIQCQSADCRVDAGFVDKIPTTSLSGSYASLNGSGGTPGLIFTGNATPDFGQGQPSTTGWVVGGTVFSETYAPTKIGGIVKTSYNYLLSKATQGGITPADISSYCSGGIANCTLSGGIPHGVYIANGNLNLVGGGFTFASGQNYVILINGSLTINERIFIPNGSTAIFSAKGNITVAKTLGEAASSASSTIQGIYSADQSFIADGNNSCTIGPDPRLNIAGSVITNAGGAGGSFQNNRDLCGQDPFYPTVSFFERVDFILNIPEFIKNPNFTYQEVAP